MTRAPIAACLEKIASKMALGCSMCEAVDISNIVLADARMNIIYR